MPNNASRKNMGALLNAKSTASNGNRTAQNDAGTQRIDECTAYHVVATGHNVFRSTEPNNQTAILNVLSTAPNGKNTQQKVENTQPTYKSTERKVILTHLAAMALHGPTREITTPDPR